MITTASSEILYSFKPTQKLEQASAVADISWDNRRRPSYLSYFYLRMCIHALCIFYCGHHNFASEPLIPCPYYQGLKDNMNGHQSPSMTVPYPTARAFNQRLAERSQRQNNSRIRDRPTQSEQPTSKLASASGDERRCRQRGHPYRSRLVPYICNACAESRRKAEVERRARLDQTQTEDGPVEHVHLEKWQWWAVYGEKPRVNNPQQNEGEMEHQNNNLPSQIQQEIELNRRTEEREMLAKMEEANLALENMEIKGKKDAKQDAEPKRWRISWNKRGSEPRRNDYQVKPFNERLSWTILGSRVEY